MFDGPSPRWFSIAAHRPFVDDLAAGLAAGLPSPEALADAVVLTPTRRAAGALAQAFVRAAGGRAVLLPQIRAIGDLDEGEPPFEPGALALELPAAIEPRRRRFELARLVHARQDLLGRRLDAAGAVELADALAAFLDSCQLEEVAAEAKVDGLVEGDLARHWQASAAFLGIALRDWPARLAELGLMDAGARRVRLLRALAEQWETRPPEGVLLAAGSTGTVKATAAVLCAVAAAPQGAVVLPGLDLELAEDAWAEIRDNQGEQHPQGAMKRLLSQGGVGREAVRPWPEPAGQAVQGRSRRRVINEALRPAEATADWLTQIDALRREGEAAGVDVLAEGFAGLSLAVGRTEEQTAAMAALLLRETLETPGATAALVTPDRDLARRVSARLTRWGVRVDNSAGAPLSGFPIGLLAALTARLAADPADPVALLGVLKHPLVRLGLEAKFPAVGELERRALRGARPRDWTEIGRRLDGEPPVRRDDEDEAAHAARVEAEAARAALARIAAEPLRRIVEVFAAAFDGPLTAAEAARAHVECLEAFAADAAGRTGGLWAGPEGEQAAALFAGLLTEAEGLPPVDAGGWAEVIERLLREETVRSGGATHARIRILGAIEARLVGADRLILAGLEEGIWPRPAPTDPFLSRPMREKLGLPPPERRLGLTAHDFAQAACAPEVVLLHTERRGGAPTVQSRWLWRLRTLARGAGVALPERPELAAWAEQLDAPAPFNPARRPAPTPPLDDRPRRLSVTRIETWVRDPYEIYARDILRLRAMDPPDAPMEAAVRGTAVHKALELFAELHDRGEVADGPATFERLLNEALARAGLTEHGQAREAALSRNSGDWFTAFEARRRAAGTPLVEQFGRLSVDVDGRAFELTAKADRIELRPGGASVMDFKTGRPPTKGQVTSGFSPQLTLTAAMLARGGFQAAGPATADELTYVRVTGRRPPAVETDAVEPGTEAAEAERALEGLVRQVRRFDDAATPYVSWAAPEFRGDHGRYDHLARVWEWAVLGLDEEDQAPQ